MPAMEGGMNIKEKITDRFQGAHGRRMRVEDVATAVRHPVPSVRRSLNDLVSDGTLHKGTDPTKGTVYWWPEPAAAPDAPCGDVLTRRCPRCGVTKPVVEGFGTRNGKPQSWCYDCRRQDSAMRRERTRAASSAGGSE